MTGLFIIINVDQRKMYSQGQEEQYILSHFGDFKGTLLDIGANDGKTFSNSLALIERGWKAVLVEPSPVAYEKLYELHNDNLNVECFEVAIGEENGKALLHESSFHLPNKKDVALLSTMKAHEKAKWKSVGFEQKEVEVVTYDFFCKTIGKNKFDFITIDAEGMDWEILSQIDLTHTSCVCVEHNGVATDRYINYCKDYSMRLVYKNAENIIMVR